MSLYPRCVLGSLDLMDAPFFVAFGRDMGAPQNVYETLISALVDGEILSSTRTSNREIAFTVGMDGEDLTDAAELEAALIAEADKEQNELLLDPGDGAPAAVFSTFRAQVTPVFDDDREMAGMRLYDVTLSALPHARSEFLTTTPALAVGSTSVTSVNTANATTGWSSTNPPVGTVTSDGASVARAVVISGGESVNVELTYTGAVDFTTTPYLIVEWKSPTLKAVPESGLTCGPGNGLANATKVSEFAVDNGYTKTYFRFTGAVTQLVFFANNVAASGDFRIRDLSRTAAPPAIGTRRQLSRTIDVGGSVATQGSIDVQHETTGLGETIVYTYPAGLGYQPPLSPWRTGGVGRTTDATRVSGAYHSLATVDEYFIPASALPEGEYVLVIRLGNASSSNPVKVYFYADSWMGGVAVGASFVGTATVTTPVGVWSYLTLGTVSLPPSAVGVDGQVRIALFRDAASSDVINFDEGWLFHTDGRLTIVDVGTRKRLSLRAPTIEDPPRVLVANDADWSDSFSASSACKSRQRHQLLPGSNNVFTVTSTALDAAVSATAYNRWHTHPAD